LASQHHQTEHPGGDASRLEAVTQVAGDVAHDFNNLLTIIIGYTDLVRRRAGDDDDTIALCHTILSAARQATDLTERLLVVSRPEVGQADHPNTRTTPGGSVEGEAAGSTGSPAPATAAGGTTVRSGPVILLVDDDAQIRELGRGILEREGYCLVQAAGAEEALAALDHLGDGIDLLLTDIAMPGVTGKELVDRARDGRPDLPVLFLSGYVDGLDDESHGELSGAADDRFTSYLGKPFRSGELRRRVQELLELSAARNGTQRPAPS
jgi:CheY-like chemotaxis protein